MSQDGSLVGTIKGVSDADGDREYGKRCKCIVVIEFIVERWTLCGASAKGGDREYGKCLNWPSLLKLTQAFGLKPSEWWAVRNYASGCLWSLTVFRPALFLTSL